MGEIVINLIAERPEVGPLEFSVGYPTMKNGPGRDAPAQVGR